MKNNKHPMVALYALSALLVLSPYFSYAQFGGLLNKASEKVAEKIIGNKKAKEPEESNKKDAEADSPASESTSSKGHEAPTGEFPVTGQLVNAAVFEYGYENEDIQGQMEKLAQQFIQTDIGTQVVQKGRDWGLTGTDLEVAMKIAADDSISEQISNEFDVHNMEGMGELTVSPSSKLSMIAGSYTYTFTTDYIRAELKKSENGPSSIVEAFGIKPVVILDLSRKISYRMPGIPINTAIKTDINNKINEIGFTNYFLKVVNVGDINVTRRKGTFEGHSCNIQSSEVPVKEGIDEYGKPDHSLGTMHALLSSSSSELFNLKLAYKPTDKLFFEAYFTHDFDSKLPAAVAENMQNAQNNPGLMVAFIIKDEKGNEAIYKLKKTQWNQQVDMGEFQIPAGFEVVSQEQYNKKMGL